MPEERTNLRRLVDGCANCHADVHQEWASTQHAKSWTDPVFQAEMAKLEDGGESCASCHAPRALFHQEAGALPVARKLDRDLGVNCVTCHVVGNLYLGPYTSQGHGGVEADPEFRKSTMCGSCHGQPEARRQHDQMTSYLEGPAWERDGKSCQTCHMPLTERKLVTKESLKARFLIGVQPSRLHTFTGARRNELVKGCADLSARLEEGVWKVGVTAQTGHALPASEHREVVLTVTELSAGGEELTRAESRFRFPDGPVLLPGAPFELAVTAAESAAKVRINLVQVLTKVPGRDDAEIQPIAVLEMDR